MEMIDLSKVETDISIVNTIFSEIQNAQVPNMPQATAILNDYDIRDIDMFSFSDYMTRVFENNRLL